LADSALLRGHNRQQSIRLLISFGSDKIIAVILLDLILNKACLN